MRSTSHSTGQGQRLWLRLECCRAGNRLAHAKATQYCRVLPDEPNRTRTRIVGWQDADPGFARMRGSSRLSLLALYTSLREWGRAQRPRGKSSLYSHLRKVPIAEMGLRYS